MKTSISPELLANYFAGRATAIQKQSIDEWARDPANWELFYEALARWENQQPQYITDPEAALQRHQARMAKFRSIGAEVSGSTDTVPVLQLATRNQFTRLWWVAASVVLVALAGWLTRPLWQYKQFQTAYGQTERITLPDGSRVVLNANSRLRIPRFGFGEASREVLLTGEASFAVTHTPTDQPFVVHTPSRFSVLVLGTEFTVNTRRQGGRVVLSKGRVKLRYADGQTNRQLLMTPGDEVTLDKRGQVQRQRLAQPEAASAWQQNRYVFTNTTLSEISQLFADNYGLQLQFDEPELANWTVSGSFPASSATELLEVLMEASSLAYTREEDRIRIYKPSN
ncbi:DUF4974 domain-containing protein [Rudanella paleaurantiibacter]|uniref:DUF4974 domain-containing protein n=1 Tax=Rudanella paleaurantiibacter TaxID=2614655 RepID=A0A7J5TTZ1_9BACT|nr:FecR domain-containing protein [Rudanella paleaurantiibacter]KAB7727360.1 DUF4974 domain-containing protein [Rudanella paleaurantiibacter]